MRKSQSQLLPSSWIGTYTERKWRLDWKIRDESTKAPPPCPKCQRIGFFGPRIRPFQTYRACRFCGFWQDVGHEPEFRVPAYHDCINWPIVAGAPYMWWIQPTQESFVCPYCTEDVSYDAARARNPSLHPKHPWWRVPQNWDASGYRDYWSKWYIGRGRAYL